MANWQKKFLEAGSSLLKEDLSIMISTVSDIIKEEKQKTEYLEMAKAYRMLCRYRSEALLSGSSFFYTEMDHGVKNMENWAEKLGIDLVKIAEDFYQDQDLKMFK